MKGNLVIHEQWSGTDSLSMLGPWRPSRRFVERKSEEFVQSER